MKRARVHRPGPGRLPESLLRTMDVTIGRRVAGLMPGEHRSAGTGAGTELALVRAYVPGDDVRQIDWNVTARSGVPHVRERVAERVLTTWVLLDGSASMAFGTADRRKDDVAEGVAIVLAHVGARRGNRVGMVVHGDGEPAVHPPRRGRAGVLAVLDALRSVAPRERAGVTSLAAAMRVLGHVSRRGSLVAIVGDFRGPLDWRDELAALAARHEVVAIEIWDPREQELPPTGHLWLVDPETGRQLHANTSSRKLRERFAAEAALERGRVAAAVTSAGARHVVVSTHGDWLRPVAWALQKGVTR